MIDCFILSGTEPGPLFKTRTDDEEAFENDADDMDIGEEAETVEELSPDDILYKLDMNPGKVNSIAQVNDLIFCMPHI